MATTTKANIPDQKRAGRRNLPTPRGEQAELERVLRLFADILNLGWCLSGAAGGTNWQEGLGMCAGRTLGARLWSTP